MCWQPSKQAVKLSQSDTVDGLKHAIEGRVQATGKHIQFPRFDHDVNEFMLGPGGQPC